MGVKGIGARYDLARWLEDKPHLHNAAYIDVEAELHADPAARHIVLNRYTWRYARQCLKIIEKPPRKLRPVKRMPHGKRYIVDYNRQELIYQVDHTDPGIVYPFGQFKSDTLNVPGNVEILLWKMGYAPSTVTSKRGKQRHKVIYTRRVEKKRKTA